MKFKSSHNQISTKATYFQEEANLNKKEIHLGSSKIIAKQLQLKENTIQHNRRKQSMKILHRTTPKQKE
jgi:hypothetical protein